MLSTLQESDSFESFASQLDEIKSLPINVFCRKLYDICVEVDNLQPTLQEGPRRDRITQENTPEQGNRKHLCNAVWSERKDEIRREMSNFSLDLRYRLGEISQEERGHKTGIPTFVENMFILLNPPFQKEWKIREEIESTKGEISEIVD